MCANFYTMLNTLFEIIVGIIFMAPAVLGFFIAIGLGIYMFSDNND